MRDWQRAWRGFSERFSTESLRALALALEADDQRIQQGVSVYPVPVQCEGAEPPEWVDPVAWCHWVGGGLRTAVEVHEAFGAACFHCDQFIGTNSASGWWCHWWDANPRGEVFAELLAEVRQQLYEREVGRRMTACAG